MNRLIGIDIGGTQIKMGAFSPEGIMLGQWIRETGDRPTTGAPAFAETVRQMLEETNGSDATIGIAAPGVAAKDGRSIAYQPGKMHGIEGFDWGAFLDRDVPVLNDGHAALLGEVWQGAAQGAKDAILLTLGTGVGGAILSDGKLLKGTFGRAGHLGHTSVTESAERSIFGTPGSLEAADRQLHGPGSKQRTFFVNSRIDRSASRRRFRGDVSLDKVDSCPCPGNHLVHQHPRSRNRDPRRRDHPSWSLPIRSAR